MLDLHTHILPRADDGAKDIDEAIEMARQCVENGIDTIVATPHYIEKDNSSSLVDNMFALDSFKKELEEEKIDLNVYLGNEIYVAPDIVDKLKGKRISTLNNSRYVLMEMPMFDIPIYMENVIYELLIKGYVPIIAHPERNAKIIESPNILYEFISKGALAQLNLPSLEGRYGEKVKRTAEIFITHRMIHFVGTDAHSPRVRSPRVEKGLSILRSLVNEEEYERLTYINGMRAIENKEIFVDAPKKYEEKKKLFSFLKSKISLW